MAITISKGGWKAQCGTYMWRGLVISLRCGNDVRFLSGRHLNGVPFFVCVCGEMCVGVAISVSWGGVKTNPLKHMSGR